MSGIGASAERCRRCLLRDMMDENDYYQSVVFYRATMPKKKRTPDREYEARVAVCRECGSLENGTCRLCGCFVEMRAARIDIHCPKPDAAW